MPTAMPTSPDQTQQDPRETEPKPPFPQEPIEVPGTEAEMTPQAYHGENSYIGAGRLRERVALITGADSGIRRAVAIAFAHEGADVVIQAFDPDAALLAYAPTKAAIVNFSKALAKEAIQKGVRVNVVAPGPVWTPLIPSTMPPEKVKTFGQDSAFGRPAQPAELAPVFVLLASPEASYITGEVYGLTGGRSPF